MVNVEKEYSPLEYAIRPLLEAANTKDWKGVLNILYLSGPVTAFSEELQLPCLVSAEGPYDGIQHSMDLLTGKAKVAFSSLIKALVNMFLSKVMIILQRSKVTTAVEEEKQNIVNVILMTELIPEFEKHQRDIIRLMVQEASTFSDLIAIGVFKSLLEFRDNHIHSALDEDEYEDMIEGLRKLGLVESRLQVSICPECANYHFTISRHPPIVENCPKCGNEWATVTLYSLQPPFSEIKIDNSDLPLFISSYLKYKISSKAPAREVKVLPKALIKTEEGKMFDVDVYIPEFDMGIECKVFEDAFAPMTKARLGSIVGSLEPQIRKYLSIGIKNVTVVTNLPENSRNKLKAALENALANEGLKQIEVLPGDIDAMLKWLDDQMSAFTDSSGISE